MDYRGNKFFRFELFTLVPSFLLPANLHHLIILITWQVFLFVCSFKQKSSVDLNKLNTFRNHTKSRIPTDGLQ